MYYCFRVYCVIIAIFDANFIASKAKHKITVLMYLLFTIHCLYRLFHLTFLGFGSWFQCFGFISETGVSTFQPSPFSILEVGGQWLMGLTQSSLRRPISLLPVSYWPLLCLFGLLVSQPNFTQIKPMASFVPTVHLFFSVSTCEKYK